MNSTLINKFKTISKESKDFQIREFDLNPSLDSLALDVWIALTPIERHEVMQQVKPAKQSSTYQNRCCNLIKEYIREV
jgi:hypothetical protein